MNIKLHGIALLDTFEKGQYSNIALDKYIKSNDISSKRKSFSYRNLLWSNKKLDIYRLSN